MTNDDPEDKEDDAEDVKYEDQICGGVGRTLAVIRIETHHGASRSKCSLVLLASLILI